MKVKPMGVLNGPLARSIRVLHRNDRRKLFLISAAQVLMSFLDLLGVLVIGLLGAVSASTLQSQPVGDRINFFLRILNLEKTTLQSQALALGLLAVFLLVGRTILSILITRRILFFLSAKAAEVSSRLISSLLSKTLITIQEKTSLSTQFAITRGVDIMMIQIVATSMVLVADVSLLIVMGIGLFYVDPMTAISGIVIFGVTGLALHRQLQVRAGKLGEENSRLLIKVNERISEALESYREIVVRSRTGFYAKEIGQLRHEFSNTSAEINFLPYVSKYIIETAVIVGGLFVGGIQFLMYDSTRAFTTLVIFLAAGSRLAPAVLRVQQGSMQLRTGIGQAGPTLDLIERLGKGSVREDMPDSSLELQHEGFTPEVSIRDISFQYPNTGEFALRNVTLNIQAGSTVAIVGPSGAGKTTLIDVLLGVITPDSGTVFISGKHPLEAAANWPGAISYVPQSVSMSSGSIRENVALGYELKDASNELVFEALKVAQLTSFVENLPHGLDTKVGQSGGFISGGQKQRIGVARAMFTKPLLLVLDEATSSLDSETEAALSEAIQSLRGSTTVIMIAHRLSTVRDADMVVYINQGQILACGKFDDVRNQIADFDRQAHLMGL
jgi:ABC-type multidrug transport system fused ATPase/permease subunit